jgi:OmpA-OmpF porin, OOP family
MIRAFLIFCFIFLNQILFSQNLIKDSGFEEYIQLPSSTGMGEQCLKFWKNPNQGHFDYYHKNALQARAGVPQNYFGSQIPHSGQAYAGICIQTDYAEYIWSKLDTNMIKDSVYCVSFYVCKSKVLKDFINEFGVLFLSKDRMQYSNIVLNDFNIRLSYTPQIEFKNEKGYQDDGNWVCLSTTYKAKGDEKYIYIGYFSRDRRTKIDTHYYIDDVSLIQVNNAEQCVCIEADTTKPHPVINISKDSVIVKEQKLNFIFFKFNEFVIQKESYKLLEDLADYLLKNPQIEIEIAGHTDNIGTNEYNDKLSLNRANAVAEYLIAKGVANKNIHCKGYGSTKPIDSNTIEEGRANNRRVEAIILKK